MNRSGGLIFLMLVGLLSAALWSVAGSATGSGPKSDEPAGNQKALKYRYVSFSSPATVDKELIRRAAAVGCNGVVIQTEGGTVGPINKLAALDSREQIFDFCHQLGMSVMVWVHELMDLPGAESPGYLGSISVENQKLWDYLAERYEWMLKEAIPKADGLVLTVVESHSNLTDPALMLKLTEIMGQKCRKYDKKFIVRTFVWYPKELDEVMDVVARLPDDVVVMSKVVPQDWQMRGPNAREIGRVGDHDQIVEYDIAGEYFLLDHVANCFPEVLKRQLDYGVERGVDGISVRVDRYGHSVLHNPQELNLWALGMLAAGRKEAIDEVWQAWAEYRFGEKAAPSAIKVLKPTGNVVTEMLSIGSFTMFDTRQFPKPPEATFGFWDYNWQGWRWDSGLVPVKKKAAEGDPEFTREVGEQKAIALKQAEESLKELEDARPEFDPVDYQILHTKLLTNRVQMEFRGAMAMVTLRIYRLIRAPDKQERRVLIEAIEDDLKLIRAAASKKYPVPVTVEKFGRKWKVGAPELFEPEKMMQWVEVTRSFLKGFQAGKAGLPCFKE